MEKFKTLEDELRKLCILAPHWQQLLIQGFWYGLISWCITCAEDNLNPAEHRIPVQEMLEHADAEFASWPHYSLENKVDEFLQLNCSLEELNFWYKQLDTIFRDCIPTDLDIFSTLASGEMLTEEQWARLYDAIAFIPPDKVAEKVNKKSFHKTRRTHGKRALTPIKRRHGITHHHRVKKLINIIKSDS
jgi:hypothetical protein